MKTEWATVRLGEVLRHREEFVRIDDLITYRRPRVQLHARGIVLRDEIPGALIKAKEQQVCNTDELLVAEIDAKVGGFGIVPVSLNGSIVSSHYFLFAIDGAKLDRSFLDYFIRTLAFREQVEAQGSTNYAAIRPSHVLNYEIPLPSLAEQQRIVARIEVLAAQIREACDLRQQTRGEKDALLFNQVGRVFNRLSRQFPVREFGSFSPHVTSGPRNWAKHYEQSGYRFYRAQDIGPAGKLLEDSKVFITPPPGGSFGDASMRRSHARYHRGHGGAGKCVQRWTGGWFRESACCDLPFAR